MKRVSTTQLIPGMVVAEDIFNYNNQLILNRGTVLTDSQITKLDLYGIVSIRVEDDTLSVSESTKEMPYSEKVKRSPEYKEFKRKYDNEREKFRERICNSLDGKEKLDVNQLLTDALDLLNTGQNNVNVFDMLHNMRQYDDATFAHCMNVALICNIFSRWLGMSAEDTELVTACGLLHDIGKLLVPKEILQKPASLTFAEFEIIKRHPVEGYRVLKGNNLNIHICNAALMHHEKCDGSGYPLGIPSEKIDKYAKIVGIADVYDAMTSARVYRGPLCPFIVIEEFEKEGLVKYDPAYLFPFLENIVNTYILNQCRLSDGREGTIIFINRNKLSRPTVKCGDTYVDLTKYPELSIECLL